MTRTDVRTLFRPGVCVHEWVDTGGIKTEPPGKAIAYRCTKCSSSHFWKEGDGEGLPLSDEIEKCVGSYDRDMVHCRHWYNGQNCCLEHHREYGWGCVGPEFKTVYVLCNGEDVAGVVPSLDEAMKVVAQRELRVTKTVLYEDANWFMSDVSSTLEPVAEGVIEEMTAALETSSYY